jgi:nucleoside-diphosphate-sugar epimerase
MDVVLTGGTGYIGSAVLRLLRARGHEVTAAVRSEQAAETVRAAGGRAAIGSLSDAAWVAALLDSADAVVHAADLGADGDDAWLDAVIPALVGSDRPYLHTGGIWSWGDNLDITEESPYAPPPLTAWRRARESRVLESELAAAVIAPAIVYGRGGGIPHGVIAGARDAEGVVSLVGNGEQHWATVHVDDLAELYVLVLEQRATGVYIGASGVNPTVRELGEAAAGPAGRVRPETAERSRARLGAAFADALLLDQSASGAQARGLGWQPSRSSVLDELRG